MDSDELKSALLKKPNNGISAFIDALGEVQDGLVMEFGVFEGGSLTIIANNLPSFAVWGFDSFEGLPEDWTETEKAGAFKCEQPKILPHNARLVVGLFQDTLPSFMRLQPWPVTFAHIDCDLYSSTKCALDNIKNRLIDGSILAFDEILDYKGHEDHEFKAFMEFIEETGYDFECIGRRSNCSSIVRISI